MTEEIKIDEMKIEEEIENLDEMKATVFRRSVAHGQLIDRVQQNTKQDRELVSQIINEYLSSIVYYLGSGERVNIRGLGVFHLKCWKPRSKDRFGSLKGYDLALRREPTRTSRERLPKAFKKFFKIVRGAPVKKGE